MKLLDIQEKIVILGSKIITLKNICFILSINCYVFLATNEDLNMDELITFPSKDKEKTDETLSEGNSADPEIADIVNSTKKSFGELFVSIGESLMSKLQPGNIDKSIHEHVPFKDKGAVTSTSSDPPEFDGKATRKRTIEFEIDDTWPPEKKNATAKNVIRRLL